MLYQAHVKQDTVLISKFCYYFYRSGGRPSLKFDDVTSRKKKKYILFNPSLIVLLKSIILVQVLLAMRANVEDRGMKGDCTPLMEAASAGHTDIVRYVTIPQMRRNRIFSYPSYRIFRYEILILCM